MEAYLFHRYTKDGKVFTDPVDHPQDTHNLSGGVILTVFAENPAEAMEKAEKKLKQLEGFKAG